MTIEEGTVPYDHFVIPEKKLLRRVAAAGQRFALKSAVSFDGDGAFGGRGSRELGLVQLLFTTRQEAACLDHNIDR